ncbi:MAG TPA: hypothetical protein VFZ97_06750 [Acidimicrobiales bacterium]
MRPRILILGTCLLLAACSAGGTKTTIGANSPATTTFHVTGNPGPPPTPSASDTWRRDTGLNNSDPEQLDGTSHIFSFYSNPYRTGWVMIWAGGKRDPATLRKVQGVIWVNINPDPRQSGPANAEPPDSPTHEYDPPNSPTWVKITSVNSDIVNLQRQDGSTLTFNLQTRHFG